MHETLGGSVGNSADQPIPNPLSSPGPHVCQGAHDFTLQNLQMNERLMQILNARETVLHVLDQRRIFGTELDSPVQRPPPRCHPETRKELQARLIHWLVSFSEHWKMVYWFLSFREYWGSIYWLLNFPEDWRMIWLSGPAGVGKSAVAQAFAEYCEDTGQLGAAFFFSRLYGRDDPYRVIPSLAYQLAVHFPPYKDAITKVLVDDPSILDKTLRVQFKKLITEPFATINSIPNVSDKLLVIILDGLDECDGEEAQCELVEIIGEYVQTSRLSQPRLLWLICSRPEWHLKRTFSRAHFHISCRREVLSYDAVVDKQDVYYILKDGFAEIHQKFYGGLHQLSSTPWPSESQLQRLAHVADCYFIVILTLFAFIGDKEHGDPIGRLNTCLSLLGDTFTPMSLNPLHSLDIIYRRILSTIPLDILPTTKRILSFCAFYPNPSSPMFARDIANFFCLEQATFYRALKNVHSMVDVPEASDAHVTPLEFHHPSFREFLLDGSRSGPFALNEAQARLDIASLCLRWYNLCIQPHCSLKAGECDFADADVHPTWMKGKSQAGIEDALFRIQGFVEEECWTAACLVPDDQMPLIVEEVRKFNFCHLTLLREPLATGQLTKFEKFLHCFWGVEVGPDNMTLLRLEPMCATDMMLLDMLVDRTPTERTLKDVRGDRSYSKCYFVSKHHFIPLPPPDPVWCPPPTDFSGSGEIETSLMRSIWHTEWFWVGEEGRTALVTFRFSEAWPSTAVTAASQLLQGSSYGDDITQ